MRLAVTFSKAYIKMFGSWKVILDLLPTFIDVIKVTTTTPPPYVNDLLIIQDF